MKKNITGFSIMIGMVLVLLMTLSAYVILAYIIPFSKNTKWIENASNAYYISYSGIEQALYHIKTRLSLVAETWSTMPTTSTWYSYTTASSANYIPKDWEWNSEYDKNYNIISQTEPIQLEIWKWVLTSAPFINFIFRVPDLDTDNDTTDETLSWGALAIINWILSSWEDSLIASGSYITANEVQLASSNWLYSNIINRNWLTLSGAQMSMSTFYVDHCVGTSSWCNLKMSLLNTLELTTNNTKIPFLEYKISTTNSIPDRYTKINSSGKSYGFQKELEVKVPQVTVNQALDFTIFE